MHKLVIVSGETAGVYKKHLDACLKPYGWHHSKKQHATQKHGILWSKQLLQTSQVTTKAIIARHEGQICKLRP